LVKPTLQRLIELAGLFIDDRCVSFAVSGLFTKDFGGFCGVPSPCPSLRSTLKSAVFTQISRSGFKSKSLANAFARNTALMPPAEVPERNVDDETSAYGVVRRVLNFGRLDETQELLRNAIHVNGE
jgi:hypothetical protein